MFSIQEYHVGESILGTFRVRIGVVNNEMLGNTDQKSLVWWLDMCCEGWASPIIRKGQQVTMQEIAEV